MTIWIDADACPVVIKQLLTKTALRLQIPMVFVANSPLNVNQSPLIRMKVVSYGFDEADHYIVSNVQTNDLVITSDIPLANDVICKNAHVLTPHGIVYDKNNIKQSLNMRDFMDTMRASGAIDPHDMGRQKPYSSKDKQRFADELHKLLLNHHQ